MLKVKIVSLQELLDIVGDGELEFSIAFPVYNDVANRNQLYSVNARILRGHYQIYIEELEFWNDVTKTEFEQMFTDNQNAVAVIPWE